MGGGDYTPPPREEKRFYYYCYYLRGYYCYVIGTNNGTPKLQGDTSPTGDNKPPLARNSTLLLFNALTLVV